MACDHDRVSKRRTWSQDQTKIRLNSGGGSHKKNYNTVIDSVKMFRHCLRRALSSWRKILSLAIIATLLFSTLLFYINLEDNILKPRRQHRQRDDGALAFSGYKDCHPVSKVAFLKTHKCASSSLQNMLLRRAAKLDLNVVLPLTGNYVGRYMPFHRSALWGTPWHAAGLDYNLFCLHTIWNYQEVRQVMGDREEDTVYFSILRDPVDLFVSLWDYVQLESYYRISLEDYVLHANKTAGPFRDRGKVSNLGRNQMLWDFGFPVHDFDDDAKVRQKIVEIEGQFDLILIAERFDESVILLKDLLCWDFEDMTHVKINARKEGAKTVLSPSARAALQEWLRADYILYEHFAGKFVKEVERFGTHRMEHELRILQTANKNVAEKCAIRATDNDELTGSGKLWGKDLVGYTVNEKAAGGFCRFFGLSEMSFLDFLRTNQGERARLELVRQNRTEEYNKVDPKHFQPAAVTKKDGSPDVEKLREIFGNLGHLGNFKRLEN